MYNEPIHLGNYNDEICGSLINGNDFTAQVSWLCSSDGEIDINSMMAEIYDYETETTEEREIFVDEIKDAEEFIHSLRVKATELNGDAFADYVDRRQEELNDEY
jgi:hypothetical protein